ncbi:MAG: preprotein translocase subunit SecG [Oscillospiraceae bacterium]|nr:preprotein translocase subunit SecG [Oscillospiraceae bacterium]MDD4368020.1 preprotein translocase subunit SecG [Oscillospiraceae bacterium]
MTALAIVLAVLDVLLCIVLVTLVIMQEGNSEGLGSIAGGADTFFGHNKGRAIDGKLKRITTILAIVFVLMTIVLYAVIK